MLTFGVNNENLSKDFPIGTIFNYHFLENIYWPSSKEAQEYITAKIVWHSEDGLHVRVQVITPDINNRYKKDVVCQFKLKEMKAILERKPSDTIAPDVKARIEKVLTPQQQQPETNELWKTVTFEQHIKDLWKSYVDSYGMDSYFTAIKSMLWLSYNQPLPNSMIDKRIAKACILAFSRTPTEYGYGSGDKKLSEQFLEFQKALESKMREQYGLANLIIWESVKKICNTLWNDSDINEYLDFILHWGHVSPKTYIKLLDKSESLIFPAEWTTNETISFLKKVFQELGWIELVWGQILSNIAKSIETRQDKNVICESFKNELGKKSFIFLLCCDYPISEVQEWENMSTDDMLLLQDKCALQYTQDDHKKNYNVKVWNYKNSPILEKLFHALPVFMRSNSNILMQFMKKWFNFQEMAKTWSTSEALVFIQTYWEYQNDPEKWFYAIDWFPHLYDDPEFQRSISALFPPSKERFLKNRWEIRSVPLGIKSYEDPMLQALGAPDELLWNEENRKKLVELNYKLYHSGAFSIANTYKMGFPSLQELQVRPPKAEPQPAMRGGGSMRSVRTREGGYNFQLQDESFTSIEWGLSTLQELCSYDQIDELRAENYNLQDQRWVLKWKTEKDNGTLIFSKSPHDPWVVSFCSGWWMEILNMAGDSPKFTLRKPVIYCYPEQKTRIKIGLELKGAELFYEYPKSTNGIWDITTFPNGDIADSQSDRKFSYIFWEATRKKPFEINLQNSHWVRKEDLETFFESELSLMWLNDKEINDFIIYWVPVMQKHKYYSIEFIDVQYTDTAILNISPKPDTLIRVFMVFKWSNSLIINNIPKLEKVNRNWYTIVEWGWMDVDEWGVFH